MFGSGAFADKSLRSAAEALMGTLVSDRKRLEIRHLRFVACGFSIRQGVFVGPKSLDESPPQWASTGRRISATQSMNNSDAYNAACLAGPGLIQAPEIGVREHLARGPHDPSSTQGRVGYRLRARHRQSHGGTIRPARSKRRRELFQGRTAGRAGGEDCKHRSG
jgi:hypothetical protein